MQITWRTVAKFAATSSSISGQATNLQASLKDLEAGASDPRVFAPSPGLRGLGFSIERNTRHRVQAWEGRMEAPGPNRACAHGRAAHAMQQALTRPQRCPADIKKDKEGRKEFEIYLSTLEEKKKDLQKRIDANKTWIENFEANNSAGSFEQQYKILLEQISGIYNSAKEFHSQVRSHLL